jgi:hypothetical protein
MPISKTLVLVSALTLTLQFLIFAYLYSSHRVRFFRYLLLAWGLLTRATFRRDWNTVRTPSGSQGPRSTPGRQNEQGDEAPAKSVGKRVGAGTYCT